MDWIAPVVCVFIAGVFYCLQRLGNEPSWLFGLAALGHIAAALITGGHAISKTMRQPARYQIGVPVLVVGAGHQTVDLSCIALPRPGHRLRCLARFDEHSPWFWMSLANEGGKLLGTPTERT